MGLIAAELHVEHHEINIPVEFAADVKLDLAPNVSDFASSF
jgi:hypothetical protein